MEIRPRRNPSPREKHRAYLIWRVLLGITAIGIFALSMHTMLVVRNAPICVGEIDTVQNCRVAKGATIMEIAQAHFPTYHPTITMFVPEEKKTVHLTAVARLTSIESLHPGDSVVVTFWRGEPHQITYPEGIKTHGTFWMTLAYALAVYCLLVIATEALYIYHHRNRDDFVLKPREMWRIRLWIAPFCLSIMVFALLSKNIYIHPGIALLGVVGPCLAWWRLQRQRQLEAGPQTL